MRATKVSNLNQVLCLTILSFASKIGQAIMKMNQLKLLCRILRGHMELETSLQKVDSLRILIMFYITLNKMQISSTCSIRQEEEVRVRNELSITYLID